MKSADALPGIALKYEEGEFYLFVSVHLDGESFEIRVPLGDGRYHAEQVLAKIVMPAIARRPLDPRSVAEAIQGE